ncbi:MAG: hypothetical protein IID18_07670, partial [Nitrospinae bacterium]|nr:hypothetical protein [Nitrospinota bacterium]
MQSPGLLAARFFSFLGSILAFKQFYLSIALGVAVFAYFIFLTWKKYYLKNPVIYFFMVFLVLSALAASLFRSDLGADQVLTYRYKIYSAVFWILAYLSFLEFSASKNLLTPKLLAAFIFPAAVIYLLSIVDTYPKLVFQKNMLTYRINHWAINNNGLFFHDQKAANRILGAAIQQGIYHPPSHLLTLAKKEQSQVIKDSNICQDVSGEKIDAQLNGFALGKKPYLYRLEGMIYDSPEMEINPVPIYFVLKSASQRLLLTTRRQEIPQMSVHFRKGSRN